MQRPHEVRYDIMKSQLLRQPDKIVERNTGKYSVIRCDQLLGANCHTLSECDKIAEADAEGLPFGTEYMVINHRLGMFRLGESTRGKVKWLGSWEPLQTPN
jgi:hypothetical protein